jgi:magnesium transporter
VLADDTQLFEGRQFTKVQSLHDIILKLMRRAIFHYEAHLRTINMISGELEHEVNTAMTNKHLLDLFTLEKSLVYYLNAINSNGKVIDRLRGNAAKIGFSAENLEFLDDMAIENNQCYELAEIYSHVLSSLMDARVSVVSNNLNLLMKTLTLVMIAIMVPTLVVSVFSMNVSLPIQQQHPVAFWAIMGLAAMSAILVGLVWRYRKL